MSGVTTPFDDPQAELGWMFIQCVSGDGDLDVAFSLLSEDFTHWSNRTGRASSAAELHRILDAAMARTDFEFHLIRCVNDNESTVIEAEAETVDPGGERRLIPVVFIFDTHDGLITSLREYGESPWS